MGWFSKNSKKTFIDEEKEIKKLNSYAKELMSKPIQFELSEGGFPLCPTCNEEFKDKETIISHLKRSKKEFNGLGNEPVQIKKSYDEGDTLGIGNSSYSLDDYDEYHKEWKRKEITFDGWKKTVEIQVIRFQLFNEIKDAKYKEWRGETKKKKVRENPISPKKRFEILKRDHYACQYCGRKAPEVQLEVDHIEPYSKTKNNDPENLITACKECNRGKRVKEVI